MVVQVLIFSVHKDDRGTNNPCKFIQQHIKRIFLQQASIKLSWSSEGEQSEQHKHDIVSFENGNITTTKLSSKQVLLRYLT